tara:strand:- start:1078 stop:1524 length:447 start_codon:yes stop_codon:yes gene_type:complete
MARNRQKLNGFGQSRGDRFVQLPYYMLESPAWLSLSPNAAKLYIDVCKRYNGINNGTISYSVREAEKIGLTKSTAARAFQELQDRGFLALTSEANFHLKTKEARLWRLTAFSACGKDATKDFMRWRPPTRTHLTAKQNTVPPAGLTVP